MLIVNRHGDTDLLGILLDYIVTEAPEGTRIGAHNSLIDEGILDSMLLLKLVAFLEERFTITIGSDEVIPENFETADCIARLIDRKRAGSD